MALGVVTRITIALVVLLSASCGFVRDKAVDGPYRLVAADVDEDTILCYSVEGGNCVGRVGATVYAAGANATYIVAVRHPKGNRNVTEYFYIVRSLDGPAVDPSVCVRGPFSSEDFVTESRRLGLPSISLVLNGLR